MNVLVMHLEFGQLASVVNGDDQFVDEQEDETTKHDASDYAQNDVEDAGGHSAFALANNFQIDLQQEKEE